MRVPDGWEVGGGMSKAILLTKDQAKHLTLPAVVWREECGGYEGSRYRAERYTASNADDDVMYFEGGSGRAWSGYGAKYCGWRVWLGEPALEEQLEIPFGIEGKED